MKTKKTYSLHTINLLKKYVQDECSTEERDELLERLAKNKCNEEADLVIQALWEAIKESPYSTDSEQTAEEMSTEAARILKNIKAQSRHKKQLRFFWGSTMGMIAAAVLFIFVVRPPLFQKKGKTNETEIANYTRLESSDKIKKVTLSDGSILYLNINSLLYIKDYKQSASIREVRLEEGEVFFEIAEDANRPFIVHTGNGVTTRVLGTSFNIQAYKELNKQTVSVKTGQVEVGKSDEYIVLEADNTVFIDYEKETMVARKTDGKFIGGWREGMITFHRANLQEVAFRLKQHYKVELSYNKLQTDDMEFTAVFSPGTPIETIAQTLSKIYGVQYELGNSALLLY